MASPLRVLVTGGAGLIGSHIVDLLMAERESGKYGEIIVIDNFVRGRRENLAQALARGPLTIVEGDIRDRALLKQVMAGVDQGFHQAAIRLTPGAGEPRFALAGLVGGARNMLEAAAEGQGGEGAAGLVG